MKRLRVALAVLPPFTLTAACGPDTPDAARADEFAEAGPEAVAIGTALDRVVTLSENRDPVQQGGRTFELSGHVLVRASGIPAPGLRSLVRERGWSFVEGEADPRICDRTMPDGDGWPHCVLGGGDPEALYLDVRSVTGMSAGGFEVAVRAYRNVSVPHDRDLLRGAGFDRAEYDRLVVQISGHPGVLSGRGRWSNPGTFRIAVEADGAAGHEYEPPGRILYIRSEEELAWHAKGAECAELRRGGDGGAARECEMEYVEMGRIMLEDSRERARAAMAGAGEGRR